MYSLEEILKFNVIITKRRWDKYSRSKNLDWNLVLKYPNARWNWCILNGRKDKPLGFRRNNRHLPWPKYGYSRGMYEWLSDFNTSEEEQYEFHERKYIDRARRKALESIPNAAPVSSL